MASITVHGRGGALAPRRGQWHPAFVFDDPAVLLPVLTVAGFLAAIVNTIAGGGSLLTLPLLIAIGLPDGIANATNRVGVMFQSGSASATFHHRGQQDYRAWSRLIVPMGLAALGGSYLATQIPDTALRLLFGVILLGWGVFLTAKPGRFLEPRDEPRPAGAGAMVAAVGIGLYGGFLQAGVGFPLLALLVSGLGYHPIRANAIKVLLVFGYTTLAVVPVFIWHDQIRWREGLVLGAGTLIGGWAGTRLQITAGANLVRWVVVATLAVSGIVMAKSALGSL